jgi:mannose-6-phosphate isomerase-like protein (cupin superfamily)
MQTPLVEGTAPDLLALVHDNDYFRRVVATGDHEQVVVMTLDVGEDIGSEVHTDTDQVFIFVEGDGDAVLDAEIRSFNEGDLVFVRAGTQHNVINRGMTPLRLITIYAPPEHAAGTIHRTKAEAALEHQKRPESETAKQRLTELA